MWEAIGTGGRAEQWGVTFSPLFPELPRPSMLYDDCTSFSDFSIIGETQRTGGNRDDGFTDRAAHPTALDRK